MRVALTGHDFLGFQHQVMNDYRGVISARRFLGSLINMALEGFHEVFLEDPYIDSRFYIRTNKVEILTPARQYGDSYLVLKVRCNVLHAAL